MMDTCGRSITYLRLSVTELCNLRCRYCMPAEGICKKEHSQMLTEDEMIAAVEVAASLGVNKLRVTGGEPLVKKNIISICRRAAAVQGIDEVAITTNGLNLVELGVPLYEAGVKRVNISLDTLNPEKYHHITRIGSLDKALAGIEAALNAGFQKVKLNTVLVGGFNDDEIVPLAELTKKWPVDVRFIELMPITKSEEFGPAAYVPNTVVLKNLPDAVEQEADGSVAKLFRLPGALGSVGLISPVSNHFCAACNRLRLTADGKLKPCLHSADEYSIKGMNKQQMAEQFRLAISKKPKQHEELSMDRRSRSGRNMNQIGG